MRCSRRWYRRKRLGMRGMGTFLSVAIAAALLVAFWQGINTCLRPAVETMARSNAVNRMTRTIHQVIADCVSEEGWAYQDFITTATDDAGRITSLTSDLASVTLLKSQAANRLTEQLEALKGEDLGIPLGTLTGWIVFSGKGPTIRVELLSVGDAVLEMHHSFDSAGINQTRHQIFLDVSVTIYLIIPGEILSETVETSVCVAETVIIGDVPETYLHFGNGE